MPLVRRTFRIPEEDDALMGRLREHFGYDDLSTVHSEALHIGLLVLAARATRAGQPHHLGGFNPAELGDLLNESLLRALRLMDPGMIAGLLGLGGVGSTMQPSEPPPTAEQPSEQPASSPSINRDTAKRHSAMGSRFIKDRD